METVEFGTSSEDDDDMYLNSVAKLKALKNQAPLHPNKETVKESEEINIEGIVSKETKLTKGQLRETRSTSNELGPRTRRRGQRRNSPEFDSDLEIVSVEGAVPVEQNSNSVKELSNSISEIDSLIVEEVIDSSEDENYDVTIKIHWRSKDMHRLNICRNENFRKIFDYFANLEKVPIDDILITNKGTIIRKTDTPASINLSVIDILEGGVVKKDNTKEEKLDENVCSIKVQTTNKKSLTIVVKLDDTFENLWKKCSEEFNVEESKIKLYFDGELIAVTDTPDSLDIDDEACFDLRLSS
ncbi:DNA repair protein Rad60 isoform X2 [Lasioglossum baleicum]|uniref:DNA repair protein Rad60 isoform X2 n=1 Tax=Lasioglossum baleicum TaxID=434251 RepID=UPI003FCD9EDC